jgi:hypothetical protein
MSKHCEVCNRSYPDDLNACPHCAEVVEVDEADVVELAEEAPQAAAAPEAASDAVAPDAVARGEGDSAVDLSLPAVPVDADVGAGASSISVIQWASLVEEAPAEPEPAPAAFDDPADADLLRPAPDAPAAAGAGAEPAAAAPAAEDEDAVGAGLDAVRNIFSGDPSASFVRRGAAEAALPAAASGDDSAVNLLDPGPGASAPDADEPAALGAHQATEGAGSGIDLASAEIEQQVVADAGSRAPAAPAAAGADDPGTRPISDAGIDLSGAAAGEGESGPHAGIEQGAPEVSESGRDLIAEQVESGKDLPAEAFEVAGDSKVNIGADAVDEIVADESGTALAAGQLPSEAEEVDLTEPPAEPVESSAVDLGGSSSFPAAPPEPAAEAAGLHSTRPYEGASSGKGKKSGSIHGDEEELVSPSEVDLGRRGGAKPAAHDFFDESSALSHAPVPSAEDGETVGAEDEDVLPGAAEDEPAADETEPAAADDEEAPARPVRAPKEKRRSAAGAWLGGIVVGGLVGTAVCLALWLFRIEPPKEWRGFVGVDTGPIATTPGGPKVAPAPPTLAEKADMIRAGDFEKARQANIENADESKPEEVALRGQYRVLTYLQQQSANKAPIKADDEGLKKGLDDLEKAQGQSNSALYFLGLTKETVGDTPGAEKAYRAGLERAKDDPVMRQRFEDALNRLSAKGGNKPAGMGRGPAAADAALLALLLTALDNPAQPPQPMPPPQPPGQPPTAEAGSEFWKALKLARDGNYPEAEKALDQAADLHIKRRFTLLGKAQNPNSDPTEEIFLRSCEELKAYWTLQDKLHASTLPIVKNAKDAPAAVDALLAGEKDAADKVAKAAADAEAAKKDLSTARKDADDAKKTADATKKDLDSAKAALDTAKADLDGAKKALAASEKKAADLEDKAAKLTTDLKAAKDDAAKRDEALKGVAAALGPMFVKPDADPAAVAAAVKEIVQLKDVQEAGKIIRGLKDDRDHLTAERDGLKTALQQRWEPAQMLTFWMPLLREEARKELAEDAIQDADRVLKVDKGPAAVKARAHVVRGLALLNEEKYPEAKAELAQAQADLPKDDAAWTKAAEAALKEASDPPAWFAARAETLHREGRDEQAAAVLGKALELASPEAKGRIVAERAGWLLDAVLARTKGHPNGDDPDLVAARQNAEDAKKGGSAEAFYLSGRIDEALGKWDAAAEDYRQALKAHPALDADGARYRAALARALMQPRPAAPLKVGMLDGTPRPDGLAALLAVALQPGALPGQLDPASQEAQRLADEILSAREGDVPFEARAQAYAIKGLWTQALRTYVEGLRPTLGAEHAAGLMAIIEGHPALRRPTVLVVADPLAAERHYDAGLNFYSDRGYAKAEKEFFAAVENDGQDARYHYYLGLSRLMQGDRDAYEDFEQGARLERENRPPRAAVSASLERVQGAPRQVLNEVRDRPR